MKTIKQRIVALLILTMLLTLLGACTKKTVTQDAYNQDEKPINGGIVQTDGRYPFRINDSYNNLVTIEKEPNRIISLGPNITETLFALNAGDKVVGRTDYCDYPEGVLEIPSVGDLFNVNVEKVIELEPDLVITSAHVSQEIVDKIKEQGIPVLSLYWDESFKGVYYLIGNLGLVINRQDEAQGIMTEMENKINDVIARVENVTEKPSVYFVTGYGEFGDFAATGDTFLGSLIKEAGAINAAEDGVNWAYSIEKLIEKDPDLLIVSKYFNTKETIMNLEGYKELTAVKEGRIYEVDENIFFRQGPRLADGLLELGKIIHPDLFEN